MEIQSAQSSSSASYSDRLEEVSGKAVNARISSVHLLFTDESMKHMHYKPLIEKHLLHRIAEEMFSNTGYRPGNKER